MGAERPARRRLRVWIALAASLASLVGCNAVVGGTAVVVVGTAGYLAAQCYDHLLVSVRDTRTGAVTCDVDVWVSDEDSSREMRPCYHAALGPGSWTVEVREPDLQATSARVHVAEREGPCPYATHTVELTVRPVASTTPASRASLGR